MKKEILLLVVILGLFTSCSVAMAARKDGVSIDKVQSCHSRGQIISCNGVKIISSDLLPSGELVEVYQIQKERGSVARAFMHGVLDVSTLGIWEVIGTPIEAYAGEKEYYSIRVYYNSQEIAQKVELV